MKSTGLERLGPLRNLLLPLALLLTAMTFYVPTVAKERVITDNQAAAASAWRIATTGTPWMEGVAPADLEGSPHPDMWLLDTADGHVVHNRTPGAILPGVPFYRALNNDADPRDFKVWVGGVAASFWTALAGVFIFLALRSRVGDRMALVSSGVLLLATPAWSIGANALWTHTATLLGISGAIWAASKNRWWVMGIFLGVGILGRPHLAVVAAVIGLHLAWRRRDWKIVLSTGLSSSLGLLALVAWNRAVFGSWSISGGYGDYVTDNLLDAPTNRLLYDFANGVGFFFAPDRGLFAWTPVIVLLLPAMFASWRQLPDWVRGFLVAGLLYSLVQLQINSFQGGQNFYGYRLALELLVCMTPALVYAYRLTAPWTRVMIGGVVGLQFAAIAIGASTERYFVTGGDMWTTSAFVKALQDRPVAFGSITIACILVGLVVSSRAARNPIQPTEPSNHVGERARVAR